MDPTLDVLHTALNGLMTRQKVVANNVANLSTPGFRASQVDFENALQAAIDNGTAPASSDLAGISKTTDPVNQDGNNVNIDSQTMTLAETELRYQAVIGAVNAKFSILKTSIQG